jgi:hypothetical protein
MDLNPGIQLQVTRKNKGMQLEFVESLFLKKVGFCAKIGGNSKF